MQRTKGRRKVKEREVNIYAIVLSFGIPKLTKKGQWMMQITLTDDSIALGNEASDILRVERSIPKNFSMTFFNRSRDFFPKIFCAGDIIRCHRILPEVRNRLLTLFILLAFIECISHIEVKCLSFRIIKAHFN